MIMSNFKPLNTEIFMDHYSPERWLYITALYSCILSTEEKLKSQGFTSDSGQLLCWKIIYEKLIDIKEIKICIS